MQIIVSDFSNDVRTTILMTDEEIERNRPKFSIPSEFVESLAQFEVFRGCQAWCDLSNHHYRIVIGRALKVIAEQSTDQSIAHLNHIMCMFAIHLMTLNDCMINSVKLVRDGADNVVFDIDMTLNRDLPRPNSMTVLRFQ